MDINNQKISIVKLKRVNVDGGDVLHVLKSTDKEFNGFQELYFSTIKFGYIKAWKRHLRMTMNLVVPIGSAQFVFYNTSMELIENTIIGEENYSLITVPPGIWFGFKGLSQQDSYILNVADVLHDPNEVERQKISFLDFPRVEP